MTTVNKKPVVGCYGPATAIENLHVLGTSIIQFAIRTDTKPQLICSDSHLVSSSTSKVADIVTNTSRVANIPLLLHRRVNIHLSDSRRKTNLIISLAIPSKELDSIRSLIDTTGLLPLSRLVHHRYPDCSQIVTSTARKPIRRQISPSIHRTAIPLLP